jgi:hypothetical protein
MSIAAAVRLLPSGHMSDRLSCAPAARRRWSSGRSANVESVDEDPSTAADRLGDAREIAFFSQSALFAFTIVSS